MTVRPQPNATWIRLRASVVKVLIIAWVLALAPAGKAQLLTFYRGALYQVVVKGDRIETIPLLSVESNTQVDQFTKVDGMDRGPDGMLYALTSNGLVFTIDPVAQRVQDLAQLQDPIESIEDIAIDHEGTLWAMGTSDTPFWAMGTSDTPDHSLYQIDPETGALSSSSGFPRIDAIALYEGVLYGIERDNSEDQYWLTTLRGTDGPERIARIPMDSRSRGITAADFDSAGGLWIVAFDIIEAGVWFISTRVLYFSEPFEERPPDIVAYTGPWRNLVADEAFTATEVPSLSPAGLSALAIVLAALGVLWLRR